MGFHRHQPAGQKRKPRVLDFLDAGECSAPIRKPPVNGKDSHEESAIVDVAEEEEEMSSPATMRVLRSHQTS